MVGFLHEAVRSSWDAVLETVPDERDRIEEVLIRLVDDEACSIIVTTGGTGPAPRDVTPEATEAVCDRISRDSEADAGDLLEIRTDGHPIASTRRPPWILFDHQSPWSTKGDSRPSMKLEGSPVCR